jgi:putative oxidoreductase
LHPIEENDMDPSATPGASYGALVLRVALGTMYIAHALLKLVVFTLPGTAQFFASVGLPGLLAYPVFAAELAGGVLLIAGWRPRAIALALTPVLAGAAWVHAGNGWVFTSPNGGWEYPAFLIAVSIGLALLPDYGGASQRATHAQAARSLA